MKEEIVKEIFGRDKEKHKLKKTLSSQKAEFVAVYGRRRVGKTHLIRHFYRNSTTYFEMTGSKGSSIKEQLVNFKHAFNRSFPSQELSKAPDNWTEAMLVLKDAVEADKQEKKISLFFDEVPWIASARSRFLSALEHLWNRYLSERNNVVLIICGSAASWMIKKVINNKGGLYGRLTEMIHLKPFNLVQTEHFLQNLGISWDQQQITDLYMAVGGIAKYHTFIERGLSAAQNIQRLIFDSDGLMHHEFERLFESLFDHNSRHRKIIEVLSQRRNGYPQSELIKKSGLSVGGNATTTIRELEHSGLITYVPAYGKKKSGGMFRLTDEYCLFHLYWVESLVKSSIDGGQGNYWMHMQNTKTWHSWSGYAFESICLKHIAQIKKALGISSVITYQTGWRAKESPGAEIDLLIDRSDRCINLCEIKYSEGPFTITKAYSEQLRRKKQRFLEETGIKKAILITLITPYGVKKNEHSRAIMDLELTLSDLFQED